MIDTCKQKKVDYVLSDMWSTYENLSMFQRRWFTNYAIDSDNSPTKFHDNINEFKSMIFGGFIRDMIANKQYNDIDIFIDTEYSISSTGFDVLLKILFYGLKQKYPTLQILTQRNEYANDHLYGNFTTYQMASLQIDEQKIDIVMNVNDVNMFDFLPDFSINNLVLHTDNTLVLRQPSKFDVVTVVDHIRSKTLVVGNIITKCKLGHKNIMNLEIAPHRVAKMKLW
jgi:hypothetical protein